MKLDAKIFVAGHSGLVGSAIVLELQKKGYTNILTRSHKEFDLTSQAAVAAFFISCVVVVLVASIGEWWLVVSGRKARITTEHPFEVAVNPAPMGLDKEAASSLQK